MSAKVQLGRTVKSDEMVCRGLEAEESPLPLTTQLPRISSGHEGGILNGC